MQHRAFERWCGGIQALNAVQIGKLRALLEALDDRLRTLAMIEARSGESPGWPDWPERGYMDVLKNDAGRFHRFGVLR